jgi:hypothetical protein
MSEVLYTRRLSQCRVVVVGNAFGKGGAELAGGVGHEDAGSEELSECCRDAGGG